MENRIKQETAPTISELKVAKIRPVMVTGVWILTSNDKTIIVKIHM